MKKQRRIFMLTFNNGLLACLAMFMLSQRCYRVHNSPSLHLAEPSFIIATPPVPLSLLFVSVVERDSGGVVLLIERMEGEYDENGDMFPEDRSPVPTAKWHPYAQAASSTHPPRTNIQPTRLSESSWFFASQSSPFSPMTSKIFEMC